MKPRITQEQLTEGWLKDWESQLDELFGRLGNEAYHYQREGNLAEAARIRHTIGQACRILERVAAEWDTGE